jgi:peptidoglycan glycosyltransferase
VAVNLQIRRLGLLSLALVGALILGTTYWQVWAAPDLADKQDNAISLIAQYTIKRGLIYASDGKTVIAANRVVKAGGRSFYFRRYPLGSLFAHPVGYATESRSSTGLESSANGLLTGADTTLATQLKRVANNLIGSPIDGSSIVTTLDVEAQKVAMRALAGKCGAAVALEPKTGKVLVVASQPSYDPNDVEGHYGRIARITSPGCSPAAPLLDRATAGLFVPGSAFKIVTATAALDSGKFTPSSTFYDPGYCIEYGRQVGNYGADLGRSEVFGNVDFTQALENSINSVFCNVGKALGPYPILDYAKRYGFYSKPPIDLPGDELRASGLYDHNRLYWPSSADKVDVGRLAFGQERMIVSPLQMAEVAATVANGGVRMQPYLVDRVIRPNGKVETTAPHALDRVMKPETASELTTMMEAVVTGGTGTAAQIPGVPVAGKTGTGETGPPGTPNTTWFIAFAPATAPRVAVAVMLQNQQGVGGTTAAPIAREIMQALLSQAPNP